MGATRHFKQSFTVTSGAQADPLDALQTLLLAAGEVPYNAPSALGVDLAGNNGVTVVASVNEGEIIEAGSLLAYVYSAVDISADKAITTQRWALIGGQTPKELPVSVRDGAVFFRKEDLPPVGRLLVLPQGVATTPGGTSLQLTYSVQRSSL